MIMIINDSVIKGRFTALLTSPTTSCSTIKNKITTGVGYMKSLGYVKS